MVLEHLFPENWLEKKMSYAIFLGFLYSLIGIWLAKLLFGKNSGLASVMFAAILLIPSLRKLFSDEEKSEEKEKNFSFKRLYFDNKNLIHTYVGIFIGVYLAYYLISFLSIHLGWNIFNLFSEQIFLDPAISGRATSQFNLFWSILSNNWWVLVACFGVSLISGNGAAFFIVWNASAWAVIFGIRAAAAAITLGKSSLGVATIMSLITLPHVMFEGGAYILAGIAGALISKDILLEHKNLRKFLSLIFTLIVVFFLITKILFFVRSSILVLLIKMVLFLSFLYLIKYSFPDKKHKQVFVYNYWLLLVAIVLFFIGVFIETTVLFNSNTLNLFYSASRSFFS